MATISAPLRGHKYGFKQSASAAHLELVAAGGANVKIRVTSLAVTVGGAQQLTFETNEVAVTGIMDFADSGGLVLPYSELGWFTTLANEPLDVLLAQAVATSFIYTYILTTS